MNKIKSGIYEITNIANGRKYIGSAVNILNRWCVHKNALRNGTHHSQKLQNAWNKYGEESFSFSVIEHVADRSLLVGIEQKFIDANNSVVNGYNISTVAGSTLGRVMAEEQKRLLSVLAKGRKHSDETKKKMSEKLRLRKGEKRSAETKAKIAEKAKGRVVSDETRAKLSALRKGRKLSPEWLARLTLLNRERAEKPISEETRKRMSESAKRRVLRSTRGEDGMFVTAFGVDRGVKFSDDPIEPPEGYR